MGKLTVYDHFVNLSSGYDIPYNSELTNTKAFDIQDIFKNARRRQIILNILNELLSKGYHYYFISYIFIDNIKIIIKCNIENHMSNDIVIEEKYNL